MARVCVLLLVALSVQFSLAQWDLSLIDPLYYLYNFQNNHNFNNNQNNINNNNNNNNNFGILDDFHQQPFTGCISNNQNLQGTCMAAHECKYSRGLNSGRGNCTYLHSCCTYTKTCNETVRARVVYFENPSNPRSRLSPCTLRLQLLNEDICQIRVDIMQLDLEADTPTGVIATCREYITVSPTPSEEIPRICGTNTNNHFYIHLNSNSIRTGFVDINVLLQQFATTLGSSGTWSMRLTQLECPGRQYKKKSNSHKKRNENQAADDFGELAPAGCAQYYTQPTGELQTFGAERPMSQGVMTTNYYAACFKRFPGTCGITFTLAPGTTQEECNLLNISNVPPNIVDCTMPDMPITVYYPGPFVIGIDYRTFAQVNRLIASYSLITNCPPPAA